MNLQTATARNSCLSSASGEGIARKLVAEAAKVLIADRDEASAQRVAKALRAEAVHTDVADAADVPPVIRAAMTHR